VLEIGTGSGYQAAILSRLSSQVLTIERYRTLADSARARLKPAGMRQCRGDAGDASTSRPLPQFPPHHCHSGDAANSRDAGAAARPDGILIAPVGPHHGVQTLIRMTRTDTGFEQRELVDVRFVPARRASPASYSTKSNTRAAHHGGIARAASTAPLTPCPKGKRLFTGDVFTQNSILLRMSE